VRKDVGVRKADAVYRIRITLSEVVPPVWRVFAVKGSTTLDELHGVIQAVIGWSDCHLHEFIIDGNHYTACSGQDDLDLGDVVAEDEKGVRLDRLIRRRGASFEYMYDYGDGWFHVLVVEEIGSPEPGVVYPVCLGGERACPPEDCGGPWGYAELLEILGDPDHGEHVGMREWIGGEFDPERFDLDEVNGLLREI